MWMSKISVVVAAVCGSVVGLAPVAEAGVVLSNIAPVTAIDPAGGDNISFNNPNWATYFTKRSAGSETYTAINAATMSTQAGLRVLDFESAQGFGTAAHTLTPEGNAFASTASISPFTIDDSIDRIVLNDGYVIDVEYRWFNSNTLTLGPSGSTTDGVFLIGDRAANNVMISGTQGLVAGRVFSSDEGGALLTFSSNISALSLVQNAAATNWSTYIALFDESDNLLATYNGGIPANDALFFGVTSSAENIRKVWIGSATATNGIVIDDIAFVAVPEPGTMSLAMLSSGALPMARRRRAN